MCSWVLSFLDYLGGILGDPLEKISAEVGLIVVSG